MRIAYAILYTVTIVILFSNIVGAHRSKKKIAIHVERMLTTAMITVFANLVTVISESEMVCSIAYSIFFSGMSWLLFFLFAFTREYTNSTKIRFYNNKLTFAVVLFDTLMMYTNVIFEHIFVCRVVLTPRGEIFYRISSGTLYNIHLLFCYVLTGFSLFCLLRRIYISPRLYRRKYAIVLAILICILIADAVYVFYSTIFESSVIFLAIGGMIIYYYALVFEPETLTTRTLRMVVNEMTAAVITFDVDGNCIQLNESACELLGVSKDEIRKNDIYAYYFRGEEEFDLSKDNVFYRTIEKNRKEMNLKIQYHRIMDKNKHYLGCFFVIEDQTEEVKKLQREHYLATHDRLTGLYNKEFFYEQCRKSLEQSNGEELLMVCSDVKNFKLVNDVFGTKAGDELLKKIAKALKEQTKPGEVYGRLESDRFALLMKKEDFREEVFIEGPKAIARIDSDVSYPLNIYVGVYEIKDTSIAVSVMCARALMASNTIKENVQKHVAYYDDELRKSALSEQELTGGLDYAVEQGQFQMYLQPQVLADGTVQGAEALVRWIHPEKGMIAPGNFLPVLERNGSIVRLDRYVWEQACKCLRRWKDHGNDETYISVNISPIDFYFMDVCKVLIELTHKYEISPKNLRVEITETALMQNLEEQKRLLKKLQEAGFIVEMDDFGSGYSSLNMLKNIEVDAIKLDMAFLGSAENESRGRKILTAVVKMAKELDMPVITEGVETGEQVDFLKSVGCDMFQGYYFAKPMEVWQFEQLYLKQEFGKNPG